jgi:hypothetical protein
MFLEMQLRKKGRYGKYRPCVAGGKRYCFLSRQPPFGQLPAQRKRRRIEDQPRQSASSSVNRLNVDLNLMIHKTLFGYKKEGRPSGGFPQSGSFRCASEKNAGPKPG